MGDPLDRSDHHGAWIVKGAMNLARAPRRGSGFGRAVATLAGGRIAGAGLSAIWLVMAARELRVDAFGDLAVLLSIGSIITVVSDMGYPFVLSHAVGAAGRVGATTLGRVVRNRLVVGVAAAGLTGLAYVAVAEDTSIWIPVLYAASVLATIVHSSLNAALRGLDAYRTEAANEVVSRAFVLVVGTAWLMAGGGLIAAVAMYALADVASMVAVGLVVRRWVVPGDDGIDTDALSWRRNIPLTVGRVFATGYARADTWLMALLRGVGDTAHYAAPYRLLDGLLLLPRAVGAVIVARVGRQHDRFEARGMLIRTALLAAAAAAPFAVAAGPIVTGLFGSRYASSADVLAVLAVSSVPGALVTVTLPVIGVRAGHAFARTMAVALAGNVALNLAVIPAYGPIGAATTTLAGQVLLALVLVPRFVHLLDER